MAPITPTKRDATPAAVAGRPTAAMNFSVGPLTALPATKGLTAITGASAAAIASRIPGTDRIGPIEITGLDGPTTIASAPASASRTSGVGAAWSSPCTSTPSIAGADRSAIRYSWSPRQPPGVRTRV